MSQRIILYTSLGKCFSIIPHGFCRSSLKSPYATTAVHSLYYGEMPELVERAATVCTMVFDTRNVVGTLCSLGLE